MTWSLIKNRDNYNFTFLILFFLSELCVLLAMSPRTVPVTGKLSGIHRLFKLSERGQTFTEAVT
jgi:hypothetical protein